MENIKHILERVYPAPVGLPNPLRQEVLNYAEIHGVRESSERFRVGRATIYAWRTRVRVYQKGYDDARTS